MKFTRNVDALGRIVIPSEIAKKTGIDKLGKCDVELVNNKIVITPSTDLCVFCGKEANIEVTKGRFVCKACAKIIKKGAIDND